MDIDFHFGTMYVLSRWAGFDEYSAKLLASASQYVDDSNNSISGHRPWEKFTCYGCYYDDIKIWLPFHFLPSLDGNNTIGQITCRKNSTMADYLAKFMLSIEKLMSHDYIGCSEHDYSNILRLGISTHVYVDTWAHSGFCGFISINNKINNFKVIYPAKLEEHFWTYNFDSSELPLAHEQAVYWPDIPYAKWRCAPLHPNSIKNWDEFMEASRAIYKILAWLYKKSPELTPLQEQLLLDSFKNIQSEDRLERNNIWLTKISNDEFGFIDNFPHGETLEYSSYFMYEDDDLYSQFYAALNDHYNWVKENLEAIGINIL
ncbi:DUF6765 family protein [Pectinatus frisingensis]|uniref:DUF6765 family protein n=1 Tax=Pectinatus frisingensis TaxID=865 RepID=UPI003D802085